MASSTAAAASGLRLRLSRNSSSNPLLLSSLRHRNHHGQRRALSSRLATLSFPSLTSHFPPAHLPLVRPPSFAATGPRRPLSSPSSASSPATRAPPSPRRVSVEEEDGDEDEDGEEEDEELFDPASSYDDDESADEVEEDTEDEGGEEDPEFHGQNDDLGLESPKPEGQQLPRYPSPKPEGQQLPRYPSPKLSTKEKKELASYAHSLGTKLKSQQLGKSGVTPSVVAAFVETLEANELLKLKVHGSCPGELPEVIKQLEESTGSVAVGRIGRSVILYRPSLSKMQKKEAQAAKKTWRPKPKEPAHGLKLQKKWPVQQLPSRRSRNSGSRI